MTPQVPRGYLLDTNVLSELRKPRPHGAVVAWIRTVPSEGIFVSAFTIGEMQAGVEKVRSVNNGKALEIEEWVDHVCESFSVLPVDIACARQWAREMSGKSDDLFEDAFLAATARIHRLTVATRNVRDFELLNIPVFNPFTFPRPDVH